MQLHDSFQDLSARWLISKYLHVVSQIVIWWIGCCWSPHVPWRLQSICVSWPSWWV
jgi:hypothetical protein